MSDVPPSEVQRSSRDSEQLRRQLEGWLAGRLDGLSVAPLQATASNGMSSETVLFEAASSDGGDRRTRRLVARIAPDDADVPVFPTYEMDRQFRVIQLVGELTSVPVPQVLWSEPDPAVLGAPFFVMEQVDGEVPPDVMPYNLGDSWLFHASADDQRRLQDASVGVLAQLHGIDDPQTTFAFLAFDEPGDTPLRRHVAHAWAWYEFASKGGLRSPLIERGFAWLDEHWPSDEGPTVLSWGDSRIGNVMYRDFEPVAVLDWEMAGLAPREVDLCWMIYAHRVFESLATRYGMGGMPHFLRPDDVVATYASLTGHQPRDLEFYVTYAAVQWGIVGLRTGARGVHFGEREMPDDPDELLLNRDGLERMVVGGRHWD